MVEESRHPLDPEEEDPERQISVLNSMRSRMVAFGLFYLSLMLLMAYASGPYLLQIVSGPGNGETVREGAQEDSENLQDQPEAPVDGSTDGLTVLNESSEGNITREVRGIVPCFDGGFVIATREVLNPYGQGSARILGNGATGGFGSGWIWQGGEMGGSISVLKVSASGEVVWERDLGYGRDTNLMWDIIDAGDDGFIILASRSIDSSLAESYILKLDSTGSKVWERELRAIFEGSRIEKAIVSSDLSIVNSGDGGCFIGMLVPDPYDEYLVKIDAMGRKEWIQTGRSATVGDGGGFIILRSHPPSLCGVDKKGNVIWDTVLTAPSSEPFCSVQSSDEGTFVVMAEKTVGDGGIERALASSIVKLDSRGSLIWEKSLGGGPSLFRWRDGCSTATSDGGFIATGGHGSALRGQVFKIDNEGTLVWNITSVENRSGLSWGIDAVLATVDAGCLVVQRSENTPSDGQFGSTHISLVKVDGDGTRDWEVTLTDQGMIVGGLTDDLGQGRPWDTAQTLCGYIKTGSYLSNRRPVSSTTLSQDGGIVLAGGSLGCLRILKIDQNGSRVWARLLE